VGILLLCLLVPRFAIESNIPRIVAAVIISAMVFLLAASVLVFHPESGDLNALVRTSAAWTAALFLGLVASWWIIAISNPLSGWHGELVLDDAAVEAYLAQSVPADTDLILVPTGVFLQSLEFLSGDNLQISGYYWQRFGPDIPDDFVRGLVFPEAFRDAYKQTEAYRYTEGDVETIGWYFETTIREPFDYTYFPFDRQDAWIRLWSRDFTYDVNHSCHRALAGAEAHFGFRVANFTDVLAEAVGRGGRADYYKQYKTGGDMAEAVEAARRNLASNGVKVSAAAIEALTSDIFGETGLAGAPEPFRDAFTALAREGAAE
jgi:hypothetical protein